MSHEQCCQVCGSTDLELQHGRMVCQTCNTQSQEFTETVSEFDQLLLTRINTARYRRPAAEQIDPNLEAQQDYERVEYTADGDRVPKSYLEAMQLVLKWQAQALVQHCQRSPMIHNAIGEVWFAYIHRLHARRDLSQRSSSSSSSSNDNKGIVLVPKTPRGFRVFNDDDPARIKAHRQQKRRLNDAGLVVMSHHAFMYCEAAGMPRFCLTLVICHIACLLVRETLMLEDIYRYAAIRLSTSVRH